MNETLNKEDIDTLSELINKAPEPVLKIARALINEKIEHKRLERERKALLEELAALYG